MGAYRRQKWEEVDNLFDAESVFRQARAELTAYLVEFYRERAPYGFAIERQSMGRIVMGNIDKTGHIARVQAIERMAERRGLHLPSPIERPGRHDGETPFIFDERFWFVDGEGERASGYTFSPEIRPRFWMAYCMARRLNEIDPQARPKAILVADVTRFTRQDAWLKVWVDAIKNEGVDVYFDGCDNLGHLGLSRLEADIQVSSEQLPKAWLAAREIARQEGRIKQHRRPFGLEFRQRGAEVWTVCEEWRVIEAVAYGLADGTLRNGDHAAAWSRQQFGELGKTSTYWTRLFRDGAILSGRYVTYQHKWEVCRLKQRNGILSEINYTKGGSRRIVSEPTDPSLWVVKEIQYAAGTAPIPPAVTAAARERLSHWRRPTRSSQHPPQRALCIIPCRCVRCAACGAAVYERNPHPIAKLDERRPGPNPLTGWVLYCTGADRLARQFGISRREAGKRSECQHRRMLAASLSIPLKQLLIERLFSGAFDPAELAATPSDTLQQERAGVEQQKEAAENHLRQIAANLLYLDLSKNPKLQEEIQNKAAELEKNIADCERRLQILAAQIVSGHNDRDRYDRLRRAWELYGPELGNDMEWWRTVCEELVEEVRVDLEMGTFTVKINLRHRSLRDLAGELRVEDRSKGNGGQLPLI